MPDWRESLLADAELAQPPADERSPVGWPGYEPRCAVRTGRLTAGGVQAGVCVWDFGVYGGSFGEAEARAFERTVSDCVETRRPLVTFVRSGGTRLYEGMAALVGIPCSVLALDRLAAAGLPHVCVVDHPTTGGVWVGVASPADLRVAVSGAVVGFSGPRVVEAMTGHPLPPGSHTAEAAYAAGLVDAVVEGDAVGQWLARALRALRPDPATPPAPAGAPPADAPPPRSGWEQVVAARTVPRPGGGELLDALLDDAVDLHAGTDTVRAVVGRSGTGRRTVGVALAARRACSPDVAGYRLLARAARLADRLDAGLLTLVDTPGAAADAPAERAGIAAAIADAMAAVLRCRAPVLAVVHGEGGSGGALAAAVGDEVLVGGLGWFAPLGPEGAAVPLRISPAQAADRMRPAPADLLALGFADATAPAEPAALRPLAAARLDTLRLDEPTRRLQRRLSRWSRPLPGSVLT